MTTYGERNSQRIRARKARERFNVFSQLPALYAASRLQGQQLLQIGGGLTIVEWRVLWDLHEAGPMTIRDLATMQRADHSLLSRALPDMRHKGFVEMQRDTNDGRQTIVDLAPGGKAAYERAAPIMARRRAALRKVYSEDEMSTFISYLDRLHAFLKTPISEIVNEDVIQ